MSAAIYILGGSQTDFSVNWGRQGKGTIEMMQTAVMGALGDAGLAPSDIQVGHVGNFAGELFTGQGHLGGFFSSLHPDLAGLPASRHEAACASGSMAVLAAQSDLLAGHYDVACVVGVEEMRNVAGEQAADHLGAAAWRGREAEGARYLWPFMFSELAEEYDRRYGLDPAHLGAIAKLSFSNAKRNPYAQSRNWSFTDESFAQDDRTNPPVEGRIRRQDCGQITDGAAALVLATESYARHYAERQGIAMAALPRITGWGHRTATMLMADKLASSPKEGLLFPHLARVAQEARTRAGLAGASSVKVFELHDCFTITYLMLLEHLGLANAGQAGALLDSGDLAPGGKHSINPSGGLIGGGHPVGATGVRMLLDCARQVSNRAGESQIDGARVAQTMNIGGSATTAVSFVVQAS